MLSSWYFYYQEIFNEVDNHYLLQIKQDEFELVEPIFCKNKYQLKINFIYSLYLSRVKYGWRREKYKVIHKKSSTQSKIWRGMKVHEKLVNNYRSCSKVRVNSHSNSYFFFISQKVFVLEDTKINVYFCLVQTQKCSAKHCLKSVWVWPRTRST